MDRHTDDYINHFAMTTLLFGGTRNCKITHANSGSSLLPIRSEGCLPNFIEQLMKDQKHPTVKILPGQ